MNKIFIFSSVHPWNDGRIFYREAKSLAKKYKVELHAIANFKKKKIGGVEVIGLPPWSNFIDRLRNILILGNRIFYSNSDIYHFHDPELLFLVPYIKFLKRKKIIYDVHEHYPLMMMQKEYIPYFLRKLISLAFTRFEWIILHFVDRVIFTTSKVGERYKIVKKDKAIRLENLPSKMLFETDPPPLVSRAKKTIFLGGMTEIRGIHEIISAFKIVNEKFPDYRLLLIGKFYSENFKGRIKQQVKNLGLENVVKIEKEISYINLSNILYDCRVGYVTFLSYPNNVACLPNKLFEYMAAGMVIVASDFENYQEVIKNCDCGLTVNPEDYHAIAENTIKLIGNEKLAEKYARNARKAFLKRYHWEIVEKVLLKMYHDLV